MTVKATQSSPQPVVLTGMKAPAAVPDEQIPLSTGQEPKGDRLALTSQGAQIATAATSTPSLGEVVSKVAAASEAKTGGAFSWLESQPIAPILDSPFGQGPEPQESFQDFTAALSGQPVTVKDASGSQVEVKLAKVGSFADVADFYQLTVGTHQVTVVVGRDLDARELLPRAVAFYATSLEHQRRNLHTLVLTSEPNPRDDYWRKTYAADHTSAATGGAGCITFWQLKEHPDYLTASAFNHEMGHLVGESLHAGPDTYVPPGWEEAAKMDHYKVSTYAGRHPDEDFAETWATYVQYRENPYTMSSLREQIPHRIKVLDAIFEKNGERASVSQPEPRTPEGNGNG